VRRLTWTFRPPPEDVDEDNDVDDDEEEDDEDDDVLPVDFVELDLAEGPPLLLPLDSL
jgi:hypothetical protein